MDALVRQGLESSTAEAFNSFVENYSAWNESHMDASRVRPDSHLMSVYTRVLRRSLSVSNFNTIEDKLEAASTASPASSRLIAFKKVVSNYFSKITTNAMQDGLLGLQGELMLASTDPTQHVATGDNSKPSAAVQAMIDAGKGPPGPCPWCFEDPPHWEHLCPKKEESWRPAADGRGR